MPRASGRTTARACYLRGEAEPTAPTRHRRSNPDGGLRAGLWTAPFLVSERSALAREHPGVAGRRRRCRPELAPAAPGARCHESRRCRPSRAVYATLTHWGFSFHKLDSLYAGALDGRQHADCSPIEVGRAGLRLIRRAAGPEATPNAFAGPSICGRRARAAASRCGRRTARPPAPGATARRRADHSRTTAGAPS